MVLYCGMGRRAAAVAGGPGAEAFQLYDPEQVIRRGPHVRAGQRQPAHQFPLYGKVPLVNLGLREMPVPHVPVRVRRGRADGIEQRRKAVFQKQCGPGARGLHCRAAVVGEVVHLPAIGAQRALPAEERAYRGAQHRPAVPLVGQSHARTEVEFVQVRQAAARERVTAITRRLNGAEFGPGSRISVFILLCFSHQGVVNSYRSPRFKVRRGVTFQSSCA